MVEIRGVLELLRPWLEHDGLCPAFMVAADKCNCGLAEAIAKAEGDRGNMVEIVFGSYPTAVEWKRGPPVLTLKGFPPLPDEDYISYSRRLAEHLGVASIR